MRLIDADTLMDCIDKNCDDSFAGMFKALVKRQPTAFDKENVKQEIRNVPHGFYNVETENEIIGIVEKGGLE